MNNFLLPIFNTDKDGDVSVWHHDCNGVAWVGPPVPVDPDLVPSLQISFELPEGHLSDLLDAILQELVQGNRFQLFSSDQALLPFIDAMLLIDTVLGIIEILSIKVSAKLHGIQGLKTRTNSAQVSVFSLCHADRAREESFHSFFADQTHQDVVKDLDGLEMLEIH